MKKSIFSLIIGILIGGLIFYVVQLQTQKAAKSTTIEPFEKTSYAEVAETLNPGGSFYMYVSTENAMKTIEAFLQDLKNVVASESKDNPQEKEKTEKIFDFILRFINNSGVFAIDGIGMSSMAVDDTINRNVITVHRAKDKGDGKLWHMTGAAPHPLECIGMLPADTVFASFSDFRLQNLWEWIKTELTESGIPEITQGVAMVEPMLLAQGIDSKKLWECLNGQSGLVVTLSKDQTVTIPTGEDNLEIPQPAAALMVRTTNDYLFGVLQQKIPGAQVSEKEGTKTISIPLPPLPVPIPLQLQIVQTKDHLILASNEKIVNEIFTSAKEKNGLVATDEFKTWSKGIPTEGNGLRFISPRLGKLIFSLQEKAMAKESGMPAEARDMITRLNPFAREFGLYGTTRVDERGFTFEFNYSMSLGNVVMILPAVATVGVVAAIAIPNFLSAKKKAQLKNAELNQQGN